MMENQYLKSTNTDTLPKEKTGIKLGVVSSEQKTRVSS